MIKSKRGFFCMIFLSFAFCSSFALGVTPSFQVSGDFSGDVFLCHAHCATLLCVKGTEKAGTKASCPKVEIDQESFIQKIQQVQYTQLLEIHRSYFTVLLQVISVYVIVMGYCLRFVFENTSKLKVKDGEGTKTILITIMVFSLLISVAFIVSLFYGLADANERSKQIGDIENNMQIDAAVDETKIKHIATKLLQPMIVLMIILTTIAILGWFIFLVLSILKVIKQKILRDIKKMDVVKK